MTYHELETLIREVRVNGHFTSILKELFEIGRANLKDTGRDLLIAIKINRGLSIEEMSEATGLPVYKLENIMNGDSKITKITADKLKVFGYPSVSFLKGLGNK